MMRSGIVITILLLAIAASTAKAALRQRGEENYVGLKNLHTLPPSRKSLQQQGTSSRIIGGEVAEKGSAPWQVSIQNWLGNHFCGGAIIDDQYVLTAASCVAGLKKQNIKVVTSTNDWMGPAWQYMVEDIIIHCNFDKPLYHNDIALLKLTTMFAYDEVTQKIAIAEEDDLVDGETLTMTGWGSWEVGGNYPSKLKQLAVTYMPYEKCKLAYGNSNDLDFGHLCTSIEKGNGFCHGDTGGPLVNGKGQLVGVGNWGIPCARGFPDVFARLSFYIDWIRTSIKGCTIEP